MVCIFAYQLCNGVYVLAPVLQWSVCLCTCRLIRYMLMHQLFDGLRLCATVSWCSVKSVRHSCNLSYICAQVLYCVPVCVSRVLLGTSVPVCVSRVLLGTSVPVCVSRVLLGTSVPVYVSRALLGTPMPVAVRVYTSPAQCPTYLFHFNAVTLQEQTIASRWANSVLKGDNWPVALKLHDQIRVGSKKRRQ